MDKLKAITMASIYANSLNQFGSTGRFGLELEDEAEADIEENKEFLEQWTNWFEEQLEKCGYKIVKKE